MNVKSYEEADAVHRHYGGLQDAVEQLLVGVHGHDGCHDGAA